MSSDAASRRRESAAAVGASGGGDMYLLNQPVVIDNGSSSIKAGFAGSTKPKVVVDTKVGRIKHTRIMPGGALEDNDSSNINISKNSNGLYYGAKLDKHRGAFVLEHPMRNGQVQDWDAMERLWSHVYSNLSQVSSSSAGGEGSASAAGSGGSAGVGSGHPLLITESPLNQRSHREQLAQIFFETFQTPALYFAAPSVLSLYASGRTTGVVLDIGHGVTHAVPVYEGLALTHSVTRSNIAGHTVTNYLQHLLRKNTGFCAVTTAELDLVQTIKQDACFLAPSPNDEKSYSMPSNSAFSTSYQLPDGEALELGTERFQAPNVLLDPSLVGSEDLDISQVLTTAIAKSDRDLRSKLYSQVVLAGGTSLMPGCGERLLYQVRQSAPTHVNIRVAAPPDRQYSAYVGGSILASLATFKNMWVSRDQYEEYGPDILHARDY